MIVIDENIFSTKEEIELLIQELENNAYKPEMYAVIEIFKIFIMECFEADKRLQQMVFDNLSDDFISFVIIPVEDTEVLDSFSFKLASKSDEGFKKRDELLYRDFCDVCFGGVRSYYSRLIDYFEKP